VTENARAQWVKYSSLLANAKESVNRTTASASESSSVQLEASGSFLIFHLYFKFS
jgi:taspase (threonine aspartase 1)